MCVCEFVAKAVFVLVWKRGAIASTVCLGEGKLCLLHIANKQKCQANLKNEVITTERTFNLRLWNANSKRKTFYLEYGSECQNPL